MQGPFPIGSLCEAAHFGWERGFNAEDTRSCSMPGTAGAREPHTQFMNRGRAKNVPAFPVFFRLKRMGAKRQSILS